MDLWRDKHTLEEIQAAAMLLGEPRPILCSCCSGLQKAKAIFGYRTCSQCSGTGFDYIGRETSRYAGVERSTMCVAVQRELSHYKWPQDHVDLVVRLHHQNRRYMRKFEYGDWLITWLGRWTVVISLTALGFSIFSRVL